MGAGFDFYLIGLSAVSFFTAYFSKGNNIKAAIIWAGLSIAIYLTLYFVTCYNAPYYAISDWLRMTLFVTHAIVVFLFVVFYMFIFLTYALSLERWVELADEKMYLEKTRAKRNALHGSNTSEQMKKKSRHP